MKNIKIIEHIGMYIEDKNGNSKEYRRLKKYLLENDVNFSYDTELKVFDVKEDGIKSILGYDDVEKFNLFLLYVDNDSFLQSMDISIENLSTLV